MIRILSAQNAGLALAELLLSAVIWSRHSLAAVLGGVLQLARAVRARRQVRRLLSFSNRELKDIGLHRSDVEAALSLPLHQDPSRKLAALIATKGIEG